MRRQKDLIIAIALVAMILALSLGLGCASSRQAGVGQSRSDQTETTMSTLNSDGDGIPDRGDYCPNTPPGSMVDSYGCRMADNNHDGTPDKFEPRPAGRAKDAVWQETNVFVVKFAANSHELNKDGSKAVYVTAYEYKKRPCRLSLEAYASEEGGPDYNVKLSQRRGQAVAELLVSHGVPADSITMTAFGATTQWGAPEDCRVVRITPPVLDQKLFQF
ncbi:OmpA family protein [Patescibacteria group bacterium]|nr:OmpA family protein [Patescibacteria group bacterium]